MFPIKSDPFRNYFENLSKTKVIKSNEDKNEVTEKIQNNLKIISDTENINDLEFTGEGSIRKNVSTKRTKESDIKRDLKIFAQFTKSWCETNPLEGKKARELQDNLAVAEAKLKTQITAKNVSDVEETVKAFSKASDQISLKEKFTEAPNETKKILENLQKQAEKSEEKNKAVLRNRGIATAGAIYSGLGMIAFAIGGIFVPPLLIGALVTLVISFGLGAYALINKPPNTNPYIKQMREIEGFKKHFEEPEKPQFEIFKQKYINVTHLEYKLKNSPDNFVNFHKLYEAEKKLSVLEDNAENVKDRLELSDEIMKLKMGLGIPRTAI